MRSLNRFAPLFVILVATVLLAQTERLPIDEETIVAEMQALIDMSPDPDDKTRDRVRKLTQRGIKAHDANRFEKAIAFFRQALEINPLADATYYELAHTYSRSGDQIRALDAITRALTLNPKTELCYILKASVLDDLGFRDAATAAYRKLLEIQPDSYLGHLNLGITLTRKSEWEQAEIEYLRAIEIQPDHPSGYFLLAVAYKTLGYDYDERVYLEKFVEIGIRDHRLETAKQRLEELHHFEVQIDPNHPYPVVELTEKMVRVTWKTELHKTAYPAARRYELTFEEDLAAFSAILPVWRETKQKDPAAAFAPYDLLLRIDDAGFLEEYIWYRRQRIFGDRATQWMDTHRDRVDAFLAWARAEGLLGEEKPEPVRVSVLDRFRALPAALFEIIEESKVMYEIGFEPWRKLGLLEDEQERFSRNLKLIGEDRISCRKVSREFHDELSGIGARALLPPLRCFVPGEPGYEQTVRGASILGLELREVEFRPIADLKFGEKVQLNAEASWLAYALAKAAWRRESHVRSSHDGPQDGERVSLEEEIFVLAVAAGAYAILLEPTESEESVQDDGVEGETEDAIPVEHISALDRLLDAVQTDDFRGYVLYEVIHKTYHMPLDRLSKEDTHALSDYLFEHVIFRTHAE